MCRTLGGGALSPTLECSKQCDIFVSLVSDVETWICIWACAIRKRISFSFPHQLELSILASIRTGIYLIAQDSFYTRYTSTAQEVERQDIGRRDFEQHWLISLWKVHPTIYSGSDPTESSPSRCPERTTTFRDRVMRMRRRRPPDHLGSLPTSLYQVLLSYSCVSSVWVSSSVTLLVQSGLPSAVRSCSDSLSWSSC